MFVRLQRTVLRSHYTQISTTTAEVTVICIAILLLQIWVRLGHGVAIKDTFFDFDGVSNQQDLCVVVETAEIPQAFNVSCDSKAHAACVSSKLNITLSVH